MLGLGQKFPSYALTGVVSNDPAKAFEQFTSADQAGKWQVVFFWPKDFTFVCPTEIAAFGKLNREFSDRGAQLFGVSTDNEYVHLAWRKDKEELRSLPFPMLSDPLRLRDRPVGRPQPGGSTARARCTADRRAVPVQLAEGPGHPEGGLTSWRTPPWN